MRVGARGVCASVRAEHARRREHACRGAHRARVAGQRSTLSSRSASRGAEPSGPAGSGLVPRVAARQPSAPGGAGRPPLRWGLTASSSLSHAGAQRVLSCRAAWRVLSLRSVRATYQESEERRHGARITRVRRQLLVALSSGDAQSTEPFQKEETFQESRNISEEK